MKQLRTVEDVYPAIKELIGELNLAGHSELAAILHDRMYQDVWTTRSELFEELQSVLTNALQSNGDRSLGSLQTQIEGIIRLIADYLANSKTI